MKEQNEKQAIEKMAKDLADAWIVDFEGNPHDLSEVLMFSDIFNIAEQLCEQNYRKQSVAIDEFAERLKEKMDDLSRMEYNGEPYFLVSKAFIDKIAEEMKGGAE